MTPHTPTERDSEREAFEAEYGPRDGFAWRNESGTYKIASLQLAWELWQKAWQARAAQATGEPVAWLHTLHQECGQSQTVVTQSATNAFGKQGRDYSNSYHVTSEPLYTTPASAPSDGAAGSPRVIREEFDGAGKVTFLSYKLCTCDGAADARDSERLEFVLGRQAFIMTIPESKTGRPEMYQLMEQDEDEDFHVISGEGEAFRTKREAIDAAIASTHTTTGGENV